MEARTSCFCGRVAGRIAARSLGMASLRACVRLLLVLTALAGALGDFTALAATRGTPAGPSGEKGGALVGNHESENQAVPHDPGRHFRAHVIDEPGSGGHHHAVVTVDGLALIVLRDKDAYKTILDRAQALSRALEETLHQGDRVIVFDDGGEHPGIYVASHHGGFPRLLLRVTAADAAAYASRSGRSVSQRLLGEWWTALIKDFSSVLFRDKTPRFVTSTHEGEALRALHSRLSQVDENSDLPSVRVQRVVSALPFEDREHLRSLAFRIPRSFAVLPAPSGHGEVPPGLEPL